MTNECSLAELQEFLGRCYGQVNTRNYSNSDLAFKIELYASFAMKRLRQGRSNEAAPNLTLAFAWAIGLANRHKIILDSPHGGEIWYRYPGVCPYCGTCPCSCEERAKERLQLPITLRRHKPEGYESLDSIQRLFAKMYPQNTPADSRSHLYEEMVEVKEAIYMHNATHRLKFLVSIREELVDVIAWIFAVATTHGIRLADETAKIWPDQRCFKCKRPVCRCGFTMSKPVTFG